MTRKPDEGKTSGRGGEAQAGQSAWKPLKRTEYMIPVDHIHPHPDNFRRDYDARGLAALARSLKRGQKQALLVVPLPEQPGHVQIVGGERRWRAAKMAGILELRCQLDGEKSEAGVLEELFEGNFHREDWKPSEIALGLVTVSEKKKKENKDQRPMEEIVLEVAEQNGIEKENVPKYLSLLEQPEEVRQQVDWGNVSLDQAHDLHVRKMGEEARKSLVQDYMLQKGTWRKLLNLHAPAPSRSGKPSRGRPRMRFAEENPGTTEWVWVDGSGVTVKVWAQDGNIEIEEVPFALELALEKAKAQRVAARQMAAEQQRRRR